MLLKDVIAMDAGLRYMIDQLPLQSSAARHLLFDRPWLTTEEEISEELDRVQQVMDRLVQPGFNSLLSKLSVSLRQVKDIRRTICRLYEGLTMDDIELFELKALGLLAGEIDELLADCSFGFIELPDLSEMVALLDPQQTGIPHFYIYDSYSERLRQVREQIQRLGGEENNQQTLEALYAENSCLEDEIRHQLSGELRRHASTIQQALLEIARLDILIAKARQALMMRLSRPVIAEATNLKGLVYPPVQKLLMESDRQYQPIDIRLDRGAILLTGANMGGKTLVLKSIALTQWLFQFGFFVPATAAEVAIVDAVCLLLTDDLSSGGLSSFAGEIVRLNSLIARILNGERLLVLIDEPARTTNPQEGKAIVSALFDFLEKHSITSVVTTHLSGVMTNGRRLRVKGFTHTTEELLTDIHNLQDYMDYSLVTEEGSDAPHEAIRIARLLGMEQELVDKAVFYAKQ